MSANGQLSPDDLVWSEGMGDWQAARAVSGLSWPTAAVSSPTGLQMPQHVYDDQRSRQSGRSDVEGELSESLTRSAARFAGLGLICVHRHVSFCRIAHVDRHCAYGSGGATYRRVNQSPEVSFRFSQRL